MSAPPGGRFRAAVFDWAGTVVDFGSRAPALAFVELFAEAGVEVGMDEARAPMGLPKRDHVAAMLAMPRVRERWVERRGSAPDERDVDTLHARFVTLVRDVVAAHAEPVPGALAAIETLRDRGLRIGSTTGYDRAIMDALAPAAARAGYVPDNLVCGDDLAEGRPAPLGLYRCFAELGVYPPATVVKVDDTAPGIAEGLAAGCLTVGIVRSGSLVGLSVAELDALAPDELHEMTSRAARTLREAGADHVIDTVADLPALLERLERGAA